MIYLLLPSLTLLVFLAMTRPSPYRQSIIDFHEKGVSARDIQTRLKVPRKLVYRTIQRFKALRTMSDRPRKGRKRSVVTDAKIKQVRERVRRNPERSMRQMAKQLQISQSSLGRITKDYLNLTAYKKNPAQLLSQASKQKRKDRCKDLLARFANNAHLNIVFTDEKIFTVQQHHNVQNDRVYASSKPNITIQKAAHPLSVMVFAGISATKKTPLIFVQQGVKVKAQNYLNDVLIKEILPWSQKELRRHCWTFMQDSAPAHKAKIVQDWLGRNTPDFIKHNEWPPSSPDCNPMDYSVWSVLEAEACKKPHKTIDSLKKALQKAWDSLSPAYLRATVDDFPKRLEACVKADGRHFEKNL